MRVQLSNSVHRRVLLLSLYVLMFGIPLFTREVDVSAWFWVTLALSYFLGDYAITRGSHALQFYYIYFVFVLMFSYLIQSIVGIRYIVFVIRPSDFSMEVFGIIVLHFFGLALGASLCERTRRPISTSVPGRLKKSFWLTGFGFLLVLVLMYLVIGGWDSLFSTRKELSELELSGKSQVLTKVLKAMPFVFVAFLAGRLNNGNFRARDMIGFAAVFMLAVAFSNPGNTARYISLTGVILVFVAWLGQTSRSHWLTPALIIGAPAALIILPATSILRHGFDRFDFAALSEMYTGLEFASIQMLIDGLSVESVLPSGTVILSAFLVLVPPPIFPVSIRETTIGTTIAELSGYVYANSAVPPFFSGYLDGGVIGLVLFSMLMGYVMQFAFIPRRTDMRNRQHGYALILFACVPMLARGDFSTTMAAFYEFAIAYEVFRLIAWKATSLQPKQRSVRRRVDSRSEVPRRRSGIAR